jgi:hypothetical protein
VQTNVANNLRRLWLLPQDGGVPLAITTSGSASKKTGKGSNSGSSPAGSLQLDEELVLEYACLLERLLPGGGCGRLTALHLAVVVLLASLPPCPCHFNIFSSLLADLHA